MRFEHAETMPWTPRQMRELVCDIEDYPQFLPGCLEARLLSARTPPAAGQSSHWDAEVRVGRGRISYRIATRNTETEDALKMQLLSGAFRHLSGQWRFLPEAGGCRISLQLELRTANPALAALIRTLAPKAPAAVVKAFKQRAEQRYGPRD